MSGWLRDPPENGPPSTDDLTTVEESKIDPKTVAESSNTLHNTSVETISPETEDVDFSRAGDKLMTWHPYQSSGARQCSGCYTAVAKKSE